MARYGYARISTRSQRDDSQLDALRAAECERIWTDTASGRLARRPEWEACLDHLRAGDELVVTRLSRMARSVRHLTDIAATLDERGIDLLVLKQGIDTTTPSGRFTFHVLAAMDEMLADLISEGTKEGLESARARGRVGGRQSKLTARQVEVARGMYAETGTDGKRKYSVAEIAETFGVSRKTVYRHLDPVDTRRQPDKATQSSASASGRSAPLSTAPHQVQSHISESPEPTRTRSGVAHSALTCCPTCGHAPTTKPEALQQREDLTLVWLEQELPDDVIIERRHCAHCQPDGKTTPVLTIDCVHCGDGPILNGTLAETHSDQMPEQLRVLLAEQGWQLHPQLICPADQ